MSRAVVLSAVRTPVGRYGGGLAGVRPDDLAAVAVAAAVERSGVDPAEIEDVYLGCANQAGEDNRNVARMAALLAGLPDSVAGVTLNRLCASGLSAVVGACHAIAAGDGDLFVAGGVESMSRAPLVTAKPDAAFPRGDRTMYDSTLGLALPEPGHGGQVPARVDGRDGRERGRPLGCLARGPGRVRPALAAALGERRLLGRAHPCRRARARRAPKARHDGGEARGPEAGLPQGRHGHGGQLERPERRRRGARDRLRGESQGAWGSSRSERSSRAPLPASTRA